MRSIAVTETTYFRWRAEYGAQFWAPEFEQASICFESVPTRDWVTFEFHLRTEERYQRAIAWLNEICARGLFDGPICVREMYGSPDIPILRLIEHGRDIDLSGLSVKERETLYLAKTDALRSKP